MLDLGSTASLHPTTNYTPRRPSPGDGGEAARGGTTYAEARGWHVRDTNMTDGRCLCGALRYQIDEPFVDMLHYLLVDFRTS